MKKINTEKELKNIVSFVKETWDGIDLKLIDKDIETSWNYCLDKTKNYVKDHDVQSLVMELFKNIYESEDSSFKPLAVKMLVSAIKNKKPDWGLEKEIKIITKMFNSSIPKDIKIKASKNTFKGVNSSGAAVCSFDEQIKNADYVNENHNYSYRKIIASALFSHAAFCNSINNTVVLSKDISEAIKNKQLLLSVDHEWKSQIMKRLISEKQEKTIRNKKGM